MLKLNTKTISERPVEVLRVRRVAPVLLEVPVLLVRLMLLEAPVVLLAAAPVARVVVAQLRLQPSLPCLHLVLAACLDLHPYHEQRETTVLALTQAYRL